MKKSLLLILSIALCLGTIAQVAEYQPNGFRRAKVPAALRNLNYPAPKKKTAIDNQVPQSMQTLQQNVPLRTARIPVDNEYLVGNSFYDLQTNNSISNRLSVNDDGTISAAWTFSPNSISTTTPPFPARGSGYNFFDGTNWYYSTGPALRQESIRTGFTNIVVTPISELLISHSAVGATDSNQIAVAYRLGRGGATPWSISFPWGHSYDTWPKACAAGTSGSNNNVYVIFQGSGTSAQTKEGQDGPVYFSKSTDGGVTWTAKWVIPDIDSTHYSGFGGDDYSIDAKGDTVAITLSNTYTDVALLKSTDAGATWTKTIIQKHPIPFYATCDCNTNYIPDTGNDTIIDTVYSNAGDAKVLLDNAGMAHVWFSRFDYHDSDAVDNLYNPHTASSDDLFYWNETMPADDGVTRSYVSIASAQDFNGNGEIDAPVDTFTTCTNNYPWGEYGGGLTQMPSAGIDSDGRIYISYQTVAEFPNADTTFYHALHRHVYMKTLAPVAGVYDPANWTNPIDLVPTVDEGGDGFNQEGVFACTGRRVDNNYAYVLYQRDNAPGHSLAAAASCDKAKNYGNSSDIVLVKVDKLLADIIQDTPSNNLFVSQNYPNPSLGITYINYGLKKSSDVKLEVYDLVGKVVFSESYGKVESGAHTVQISTSTLNSGVYTYSIVAGGEKFTRQMIVQ